MSRPGLFVDRITFAGWTRKDGMELAGQARQTTDESRRWDGKNWIDGIIETFDS